MGQRLLGYRRGDTFSYGTVNTVTLRTSAWSATMSMTDPRRPNLPPVTNVAVEVRPLRQNAQDGSMTDYLVTLFAAPAATMDWPVGNLVGVVTLRDSASPQNVVSSSDFAVVGR